MIDAEHIPQLLADVAEGFRVLRVRDGIPLTEDQISERARNVVGALIGNYDIRPIVDPIDNVDHAEPRSARGVGASSKNGGSTGPARAR